MFKPLDKETISAWRDFAQSEAFERGLSFVERVHCPKANRLDKPETQLNDSLCGTGFRDALEKVRTVLTSYEEPVRQDPSIPSLVR